MFQERVSLSRHSHYKIGGPARYFFEAKNIDELIRALNKARQSKIQIFILGGGTNILFSDDGFNGLVLKPNVQFVEKTGNSLRVGAGVSIADLVGYSIAEGLSGLEWAAGLPGTLGGSIRGNAGCFGKEIKDVVSEVISIDVSASDNKIIRRKKEDCDFSYRSNIFKATGQKEIILEAILNLEKGDERLIKEAVRKNLDYREAKQPLEYPSIGSIFKNVPLEAINGSKEQIDESTVHINHCAEECVSSVVPFKIDPFPVIPAAHLISEAGLKGISYGGAMISPKHPNFIVNILNATANDVENLIQLAKKEVKKKFGIELEEEIVRL